MTKLEALKKTQVLWTYMSRTGSNNKRDAYKELKMTFDYRACPCCGYVGKDAARCTECPLSEAWLGCHYEDFAPCCKKGSPYYEWTYAMAKNDRKEAAKKIVALCDNVIKEMEQNGSE